MSTIARRTPLSVAIARLTPAILAPAIFATTACAAEVAALPIIVTYEIQRESAALRVEARQPRTFWIRQIMARIEDHKPESALGLAKPVTADVSFTLDRTGRVVGKSLAKSSGDIRADAAALAMLERAGPFPPMPAGMSKPDLTFTLPLRFR